MENFPTSNGGSELYFNGLGSEGNAEGNFFGFPRRTILTPPVNPVFDQLHGGYNFDGDATDVLGINNGTLTNGATADGTGKIGQSLVGDGINDHCALGSNIFVPTGDFSVSFWFNYQNLAGQHCYISANDATGGGDGWFIFNDGSTFKWLSFNAGATQISLSVGLVSTGYRHIVITHEDGVGQKVYLDNSVATSSLITSPITYSATTYQDIGIRQFLLNTYIYPCAYDIDAMYLYNRKLEASDVSELWNIGNGLQF